MLQSTNDAQIKKVEEEMAKCHKTISGLSESCTTDGESSYHYHLADSSDLSQAQFINSPLLTRAREREQELVRIHLRIKTGLYGLCGRCGKEIEQSRLEAYPTAETCIGCMNK